MGCCVLCNNNNNKIHQVTQRISTFNNNNINTNTDANTFSDYFTKANANGSADLISNNKQQQSSQNEYTSKQTIPIHPNNTKDNNNNNNNDDILIPYPKITISFMHCDNNAINEDIYLTPNSLTRNNRNALIKESWHKFTFGNDDHADCKLNDIHLSPIQFYIFCDHKTKTFNAVDNESGTGLFVKIENEIVIDRNIIVSFCIDHMRLYCRNGENGGKELRLKLFHKEKENVFDSTVKQIVTIGRGKECDIVEKKENVSKVQCTIIYVNNNWVLYDGVYNNKGQKKSTNGLWLLATKPFELKEGSLLKSGVFRCTVKEIITEGDNNTIIDK